MYTHACVLDACTYACSQGVCHPAHETQPISVRRTSPDYPLTLTTTTDLLHPPSLLEVHLHTVPHVLREPVPHRYLCIIPPRIHVHQRQLEPPTRRHAVQ